MGGCLIGTFRAYYRDSYIVQRREVKRVERTKTPSSGLKEKNDKEEMQKFYKRPSLSENKEKVTYLLPIKVEKTRNDKEVCNLNNLQNRNNLLHLKQPEINDPHKGCIDLEKTMIKTALNDDILTNRGNTNNRGTANSKCRTNSLKLKDMSSNIDKDKFEGDNYSEVTKHDGEKNKPERDTPDYEKDKCSKIDDELETYESSANGDKIVVQDFLIYDDDKHDYSKFMSDKYKGEAIYENVGPFTATLPSLERIRPVNSKKTVAELLSRMRDKIGDLVEKQFEVDYKIVMNEMVAKDIATKLSYFASQREVEKFNLHVEEFDSVSCLILGLAGRLAKAEQDILEAEHKTTGNQGKDYIMLPRRKSEKLASQLSEAQWIKNNIDRRSKKVHRSILRYLGNEDLEKFRLFIIEKENLISDSKELSDKLRLSKKQMLELELGEGLWGVRTSSGEESDIKL